MPYSGTFHVGILDSSIYLLNTASNVVMEFDTTSETFTIISTNPFPATNGHIYLQQYAQYGCTLYFPDRASNPDKVYSYDLLTQQVTTNNIPAGDIDGFVYWCQDDDYIYLVGGYYSNDFKLYDRSTNAWVTGPSLNTGRYDASCEVAPNGKLYAIGSWTSKNTVESILINNILSNSWVYLSDTTTFGYDHATGVWGANTVIHGDIIYVMGNEASTDLVYIIDTTTDTIKLLDDRMAFATGESTSAIVNNVLYVFGRSGNWQKLQLLSIDKIMSCTHLSM